MVTSEQAARIACTFLTQFYKGFVEDFSALLPFYGDASCISFASFNETVGTTSQGKSDIRAHYDRLQEKLGQRKVQIRNADFVPSADGSVAVTCSGQVFTRLCRRVFMHSFVLAPTKYRESTFYIAAECLRFLSEEAESVPPNCVIVTPEEYHRSLEERNAPAPPAKVTEPVTETSQPRKERAERPARRQKAAPAAVEATAPAPPQAADPAPAAPAPAQTEAKPAEKKPRERKPRPAAEGSAASPGPRKLTSKVRLFEVPKFIKLSDIRAVAETFGTIVDLLWFQETDAIIEFSSPKEARNLVVADSLFVKRKLLAKGFFFDTEQ
jgi:hypothetical protein